MAWPLTPLTTYLPGGLPAIKASDLNAIQDAINKAFLGKYSFAGLVVDGTGGNATTPLPGGLSLTGPASIGGSATIGGGVQCASLSAGGNVAAGANLSAGGSIAVGARALSAAVPGTAVQKGVLYGDACPIALAHISGNGTLNVGFGIQSIKWYGTPGGTPPNGTYDITLQLAAAGNYTTLIPIACGGITGNGVFASALGISNNVVRVQTYETSFSTSATFPMDFFLIVYAL